MRGRQKGRPTKWAYALLNQKVAIGKPGVTFEIWHKWKKRAPSKLGTLTVSVGGLRWWPLKAKRPIRFGWDALGGLK